MYKHVWRKIGNEFSLLKIGLFPGLTIISIVLIARAFGLLQPLEWFVYDSCLRLRRSEPIDERILIVGIDEEDIQTWEKYPIADGELAALLQQINTFSPRAIGLDIVRDLPVPPGHQQLIRQLQQIPHVFVIEKVLPVTFPPPPGLDTEKVGFSDQMIDMDGKLRRSLLATPTEADYKFSLSLLLAKAYLKGEGYAMENGIRNPNAIRFGEVELTPINPDVGGYVRVDAGGNQILLNYRSGQSRFRTISATQLKTGNFDRNWIRDRIVIIGMTAASVKDYFTTAAVPSVKPAPGRIYGVEVQAHAVSQITSAVLEKRPLIRSWNETSEYGWIITWGLVGIAFARATRSPFKNLLGVGMGIIFLLVIGYTSLLMGWWIPLAPALLLLGLNGIALTALYQYEYALNAKVQSRQTVIERTFATIHNGPLQTLARSLKRIRDRDISTQSSLLPELEADLEKLNRELRGIYEFLQQEPIAQENSLYLERGIVLNLQDPIHEVLYQVYNHTLERDLPCFHTLRVKIRSFEAMDGDTHLSFEEKLGLCRFLEEALCNVGKHANGVTRLDVSLSLYDGWYTLSIIDDGLGENYNSDAKGTQQCRHIARQLRGKFRRSQLSPRGMLCELSWPKHQNWWRKIARFFLKTR